jgi:hypothetical protein
MVHVQEVDLTALGVTLPADLVGMVVMQPFLKLKGEPFRCEPRHKAEQLAALERMGTRPYPNRLRKGQVDKPVPRDS